MTLLITPWLTLTVLITPLHSLINKFSFLHHNTVTSTFLEYRNPHHFTWFMYRRFIHSQMFRIIHFIFLILCSPDYGTCNVVGEVKPHISATKRTTSTVTVPVSWYSQSASSFWFSNKFSSPMKGLHLWMNWRVTDCSQLVPQNRRAKWRIGWSVLKHCLQEWVAFQPVHRWLLVTTLWKAHTFPPILHQHTLPHAH